MDQDAPSTAAKFALGVFPTADQPGLRYPNVTHLEALAGFMELLERQEGAAKGKGGFRVVEDLRVPLSLSLWFLPFWFYTHALAAAIVCRSEFYSPNSFQKWMFLV